MERSRALIAVRFTPVELEHMEYDINQDEHYWGPRDEFIARRDNILTKIRAALKEKGGR